MRSSDEIRRSRAAPVADVGTDTRVLVRLSWIFAGLGAIALIVFLGEPDVHARPQAAILAGTALLGAGSLRLLARLLRD